MLGEQGIVGDNIRWGGIYKEKALSVEVCSALLPFWFAFSEAAVGKKFKILCLCCFKDRNAGNRGI